MDTPLLEAQNVTVYRGRTEVFSDLTLTLSSGVSTAILGPNGSGKSTLIKLLYRELYPWPVEGYVKVLGQQNWHVAELRRHIGLVGQELEERYRKNVNVRDVVLSGFFSSVGLRGVPGQITPGQIEAATRVMDQMGIADLAQRPLNAISTGQQRRCFLARALVQEPKILVLDEPTAGLDLQGASLYLTVVRALIRSGKTLILVTHHPQDIPPEIQQVLLIKKGQVLAQGHKDALMTADTLSELYDVPLQVSRAGGYFFTYPSG